MSTLLSGPVQSVFLPPHETGLARVSSDTLARFDNTENQPLSLRLENPLSGQFIEATIPAIAVRVLVSVLDKMAKGQAVTLSRSKPN